MHRGTSTRAGALSPEPGAGRREDAENNGGGRHISVRLVLGTCDTYPFKPLPDPRRWYLNRPHFRPGHTEGTRTATWLGLVGLGLNPGSLGFRKVLPAGGGGQSFWRGRPSPELEGPRSPASRGPGR